MANFELDPEFFLPTGHNIIDGGPDRLPRNYTTPAVPITRRHESFVIADVHPTPPGDNVIQGLGFRGQEGFRQGCFMILGVPLDFRNTEDLRAAVNTFGEFHHWVSDDPYLVRSIVFAAFPDDRLVPRSINFSEYAAWGGAKLPGHLVHDNRQFALPPYPALGWNAVPLAPGDPGAPAANAADDGGWGQPCAAADDGGWGQPLAAADGRGWEPEASPEAPAADPDQDQESMVIDQPSPSSSDSVHELVDLDPQPQGDMEVEPAAQEPPLANPDAPDAGMPLAAPDNDAEPEEDVSVMEEAHDENPLAIVLYKPPPIQTDNIFVGAARVVYEPPLPPVMSWARIFDALMGAATAMHVPCQLQMPILEPIMIPKRSWAVAFDAHAPEPSLSEPAISMQEVIPLSPSSSTKDLSFRSPAPSKKGTRKKATPVVDSSVRRCTRGSIKRDRFKPILQELPAHVPKKRKPKAKTMTSTSQETKDVQVPPATPIPVIQEVGQSLHIAPEKLTVDRLMEDPADSAPSSSDV
uniref:DUF7597 domain-containing protein n=1 Tax=Hordeum vulgare subsp. vulgare TaxID=112509 RepID=A0A8I6WCY0_HORVV